MSGGIVGRGDGLVKPAERRADRRRPYAWRRDGKFALLRHREPVLFELPAEHIILTLQTVVIPHFVPAMAAAVHIHPKKTRATNINEETRDKDTDCKGRNERHKTFY